MNESYWERIHLKHLHFNQMREEADTVYACEVQVTVLLPNILTGSNGDKCSAAEKNWFGSSGGTINWTKAGQNLLRTNETETAISDAIDNLFDTRVAVTQIEMSYAKGIWKRISVPTNAY